MLKQLHPNIRIRLTITFLTRFVHAMLMPFMAIYLSDHFGEEVAGMLLILMFVLLFISSIYGGQLTDSIGRKKTMVIGETINVFAFFGLLMVSTPLFASPIITYFMVVLNQICTGLIAPASEAMLIDASKPEDRSYIFSLNYWAINLGMVTGMLIAILLFENYYLYMIIGIFALSLLTLWLTSIKIDDTFQINPKKTKKIGLFGWNALFRHYTSVMKDTPFLLFTIGGIAIASIEPQLYNFISVRIEKEFTTTPVSIFNFQFALDGIKVYGLIIGLNTLLILGFIAWVTKKFKGKPRETLLYTGFTLFGISFAYLSFSNFLPGIILAVALYTFGELLFVPARQSLLADIIDPSQRGAYLAVNGFILHFGKLFGAAGLTIGARIGSIGMGMLILLVTLLSVLFTRSGLQSRRKKEGTAEAMASS
ncbi:MFS transporter [Hazenella sp. IB182357]|uniref:MFS transporter n=1 Tax=Polycladospora coralii TaxID=2771432 RepID=A0A926NFT7_9BACL|nr:MFS transporter [Polycladospora coralii]MBD1372759.1 MFS transporter [Polycladospora coralii]MBS7531151.1 MFS transporter [Polycladospora coralii]